MSRHIARLFKGAGTVYKNRQYQEINEIENTCFSKSFIYWILYKYAGAWFLGSYNSRFPGWCFSSESAEICFPPRNLPKDPFENLYNYIVEQLATFRENDIKVSIPELLQYKDPADDAKIVYNPKTGERTIEEVPGTIIKVNPSRSVMDEVKRLVRFIGNDLIIKGQVLIIPAGSVVLIPQEKQESISPVERMQMLINEWDDGRRQKDEERKIRAKTIVDSCPLVDRFIDWAKSQDWYELWAFLIKKFYELEPEEYLHSDFVFRILNNSRPDGYISNVLFPWEKGEEEMRYEVREFLSSLQPDVKNFIYEDRRRVVREIENEIESNPKGYLIKRPEEIIECFGLDAKRLEDIFLVLHNSLQSRIEFAPYKFKKHICLYRHKSGIIDWSLIWRWKERYEAQYSFIRIAAQMVRPTCLEEIDISFIQKFITIQKMDANAKLYFLYCFVIFSIDGPEIRSYNFSNLSKEQKSEYYVLLEEFARKDIKRVAVLEKYKHKFLTS